MTKVWQDSLDGPPSIGRVHQPKPAEQLSDDQRVSASSVGWCRPEAVATTRHGANDDRRPGDDAKIQVAGPDQIVPRRSGVSSVEVPADGIWTSYEFWMGIVAGAAIIFVIKTVLAVQAPWYAL